MTYTVHLRRESDGLVRDVKMAQTWGAGSRWFWTDGMMGCDCWRKLEFDRAGVDLMACRGGCGKGAYTIVGVDDHTGAPITDWDKGDDDESSGQDGMGAPINRQGTRAKGRRARPAEG